MTLDTNILIAYLDGEALVVEYLNALIQSGRVLFLPATTHIELLSFPQFTEREVRDVETFLQNGFVFVPIGREVSQITARIRRSLKIKTPDATIAATALFTGTPLLTRNLRDFKKISGLTLTTP